MKIKKLFGYTILVLAYIGIAWIFIPCFRASLSYFAAVGLFHLIGLCCFIFIVIIRFAFYLIDER